MTHTAKINFFKSRILTLILLIISICSVVGFGIMIFHSSNSGIKHYAQGEGYKAHKSQQIGFEEAIAMEENIYYVLYYQSNCSGCHNIEDKVCNYIDNKGKGSLKSLYLVNVDYCLDEIVEYEDVTDENGNLLYNKDGSVAQKAITNIKGVTRGMDIRIPSVPLMILVSNGRAISYQIGASMILQELESSTVSK